MEGNYIQLQQKLQNMKISINEITRIIEKKTEMIASLKEQQKEINKKIHGEELGLNENLKKKEDMEKTLNEASNSYKQLEDAVSSILNMLLAKFMVSVLFIVFYFVTSCTAFLRAFQVASSSFKNNLPVSVSA